MTRRINQCIFHITVMYDCLLGKNSNPPGSFNIIIVQKSILVIHTPRSVYRTALIKQCFGKRGLACINMRKNAHNNFLHILTTFRCRLLNFQSCLVAVHIIVKIPHILCHRTYNCGSDISKYSVVQKITERIVFFVMYHI